MCRILPVYGVIMAISYSGLLAGRYRLQLRPLRPGEEGRKVRVDASLRLGRVSSSTGEFS